jgi:hypothetical protein
MTEAQIRSVCLDVASELIRTQLDMPEGAARLTAREVVDALLQEFGRAGVWLTELEPLSSYEITLRRTGETRLHGSLRFTTDATGAIRTADLGALFL